MEDKNIKSDRWTFTSFNKKPIYKEKLCIYMVMQKEFTCKGQEHWQGYVEFSVPRNASQVSSILKMSGAHVEIARCSREVNYLYCTKNESFAGERVEYGDIDTGINKLNEVFNLDITSSNTGKP